GRLRVPPRVDPEAPPQGARRDARQDHARLRARARGGEAVAALDDRAAHEAPGALPLHRVDPAHLPVPRCGGDQGDAPDGVAGALAAGAAAVASAAGARSPRGVGPPNTAGPTPRSHCQRGRTRRTVPSPRPRPSVTSSRPRSEEHTSELQSLAYLVCRLLLE